MSDNQPTYPSAVMSTDTELLFAGTQLSGVLSLGAPVSGTSSDLGRPVGIAAADCGHRGFDAATKAVRGLGAAMKPARGSVATLKVATGELTAATFTGQASTAVQAGVAMIDSAGNWVPRPRRLLLER